MGEPRPSQATAPDCQPLTEQPGKDLQAMGRVSSGQRPGGYLAAQSTPAGTAAEPGETSPTRGLPLSAQFDGDRRPIPVIFPKKGRKHAEFATSEAPSL